MSRRLGRDRIEKSKRGKLCNYFLNKIIKTPNISGDIIY